MTSLHDGIFARLRRQGVRDDTNASGMSELFAVRDPATGSVIAHVRDASIDEANTAATNAAAALASWRTTPARARSEVLRRAFDLMTERSDEIAALICAENGKSAADGRSEATYAAEFFRWYAEEGVRTEGAFGPSPAGATRTVITHRPVGVAALITPWNFPAAMVTRKLGPALAAGCTVVVKPASETPLTALYIADLLSEAGVPDGVVNVVTTSSSSTVVGTWMQDRRIRKISFTGSTPVGRLLLHQAADRVVNASMELGGSAPFIVTDGADLNAAVLGAMTAKFRNGGQACTAANAFYVHEEEADAFTAKLISAVRDLRIGPAADSTNDIGPMITAQAASEMRDLVNKATSGGARIAFQAELRAGLGPAFFPPTVLTDLQPTSEVASEEIFGPIAPIVTWTNEQELIDTINASEYGLSSYVYASDLGRAMRIGEALDTGMVGVHRGLVSDPSTPFGGTKQSGLGREGAREGIREFQETKYMSVAWE
ncbi:NAD-dependent succinate-semialdehyde dehydrogenase [Saccharopolyspora tripterygii]